MSTTPSGETNRGGSALRTVRSHQFILMILLALIISFFLVYVALSLYRSSGTLQLDLSRPGYDSAREEASKDRQVFKGYSADGPINVESLKEFDTLYRQKAADALSDIKVFSGDSLSDSSLQLDRDKSLTE